MTKLDADRMAAGRLAATRAQRAQVKEQLRQGAMPFEIDSPERAEQWLAYHHSSKSMVEAVDEAFAARREGRRAETVLERIIGRDDLLSVLFLTRGAVVARAVGAIGVGGDFFGTGFMVTPRLLLTNHHVLEDADSAAECIVAFNYEDTLDGRIGPEHRYALDPASFFVTSEEADLDYTLVAVKPVSVKEGPALADFGHVALNPSIGKCLLGESLNIIQHPDGGRKRVALRENRLTAVLDRYLHYEGDTNPGSSGSPVFNDQWDVVALHHSAGPRDAQGRWVANEGIRISQVVADVWARVPAGDPRRTHLAGFPSPSEARPVAAAAPPPPGRPASAEPVDLDRDEVRDDGAPRW